MDRYYKELILILRKALINDDSKINPETLSEIENLAINQMVLPIAGDGVTKMGLQLPEKWKLFMITVAMRNCKNLDTQQKILNILKENNIQCVILKGISVSMYYHEPLHRPLGDIDILVDEENYDKAINILTGSTERVSDYSKHKFHYHFTYDGLTVEVHKFMTEYSDDKYGEFLKEHLKNALNNIEIKQYKCYNFPVLSCEFQIISLLLHTQRHFFEHKTNLRMICDYAMYIQTLTTEDWNMIYPTLEKLNLNTFADALILLCREFLGIQINWEVKSNISHNIIENLMEEFLNDGLSPKFAGSSNKISIWQKLKSIFFAIHSVAKNEFDILEKAPILYPWFWIFVPLRTLLRKIKGNKKTIQIADYSIAVERRKKLCKKLNLND